MSIHYLKTNKFYELLENEEMEQLENSVSAIDSINAVNDLAIQAIQPEAGDVEQVIHSVNVASQNIEHMDNESVEAIAILGNHALSNEAADIEHIENVADIAVSSINNNIPANTSNGIQALEALANIASSPSKPISNNIITTAANTVIKSIPPTQQKQKATENVKLLTTIATTKKPVSTSKIIETTKTVVDALLAKPSAKQSDECYPMRHYDISNVQSINAIHDYEDYKSI